MSSVLKLESNQKIIMLASIELYDVADVIIYEISALTNLNDFSLLTWLFHFSCWAGSLLETIGSTKCTYLLTRNLNDLLSRSSGAISMCTTLP